MILKRLYLKGKRYSYYFHPEIKTYHDFIAFSEINSETDCYNIDNADYVIDCLSHEEQKSYWMNSVKNIMFNTRYILDNLDSLNEFKVRWNNYGFRYDRITVGKPPEYLNKACNIYNFVA